MQQRDLIWFLNTLKELELVYKRIDFSIPLNHKSREYEHKPRQLINGIIVVYRHCMLYDHCLVHILGIDEWTLTNIWTYYRLGQSFWARFEIMMANKVVNIQVKLSLREKKYIEKCF